MKVAETMPQQQQATRLVLIRHAESVANANHIMQGWSDAPLSPQGEEQAMRLAAWLRTNNPGANALFASPLTRAYKTARYVGETLGLPVQTREGLRELGLGLLEDAEASELEAALKYPDFEARYGVETLPVFGERVLGTLFGLLAVYEGSTLVVVAHGGVIGMALSYWLNHDISRTWTDYYTENTSINELVFGEQQVEMVRYNQLDHTRMS